MNTLALTNDDGREPIAIGHLCDLDDLKNVNNAADLQREEFGLQSQFTTYRTCTSNFLNEL